MVGMSLGVLGLNASTVRFRSFNGPFSREVGQSEEPMHVHLEPLPTQPWEAIAPFCYPRRCCQTVRRCVGANNNFELVLAGD